MSLPPLVHPPFHPPTLHQIYVDKLVKVAYENWENVVEYDGEALIGMKANGAAPIDATTEEPRTGSAQGSAGAVAALPPPSHHSYASGAY